jgi:hypothetical protein
MYRTNGPQDTLDDYALRGTGFTIYSNGTAGYIFGTSGDGFGGALTEATAVHFDSVGDVDVVAIYGWVARKHIVGTPDVIKAELYSADVDSMPLNLLAYGNANMGFVDTNVSVNFNTLLGLQIFLLNQGTPHVNGPFLVGLNYAGIDDTLGLVSNIQGDGLSEKRCRQLAGALLGGTWMRLGDLWTITGNPMDADPVLYPIVEFADTAASVGQSFHSENFNLYPVSPNPAPGDVDIHLEVAVNCRAGVYVFDAAGKIVFDSGMQSMNPGDHFFHLEKSLLSPGTYYYAAYSDQGDPVTSRLRISIKRTSKRSQARRFTISSFGKCS